MTSGKPEELELMFPLFKAKNCPGLALDIGGSQCKFIYRHKGDWKKAQETQHLSHTTLRLASFPRSDISSAIAFIKENADISRKEDGSPTDIFATGKGVAACREEIEKKLNVKLSLLNNENCYVGAHQFIFQHVPTKDLALTLGLGEKYHEEFLEGFKSSVTSFGYVSQISDWQLYLKEAKAYVAKTLKQWGKPVPEDYEKELPPPPAPTPVPEDGYPGLAEMEDSASYYPCLLLDFGEAVQYIKCCPWGEKFEVYHSGEQGGKTLMGLASLLVGVKDLDDLVDLAEKGNMFALHTSNQAHQTAASSAEQGEDTYSRLTESDTAVVFFCFGQAEGRALGDFRQEDIAAALLFQAVAGAVHKAVQLCGQYALRHLMVCGSIFQREYVRRLFSMEFYSRMFQKTIFANDTGETELRFLKHGSYLGAIGCLVNTVEPFHPASN